MVKRFGAITAALVALFMLAHTGVAVAGEYITVASTTSTRNSGLYDHILPIFTKKTGVEVRVVAVGTGQAIRMAANGDADVLFVHHKASEKKFVADGFGVERFDVMYNDFVIVGPKTDPAGVGGSKGVTIALAGIANKKAAFASRGDDSGTHKKELGLWKAAGADPRAASGSWYRETGSGMGATLNTASALNAYTLTDRATWLKFKNKGELTILVEGDERLFNQYGIILVNPKKYPHIKAEAGKKFVDWVLSNQGQKAIAEYRVEGLQAFFPNGRAATN